MGVILHDFISRKQMFSLEEANLRLKGFNYGDCKNICPEILATHVKKHRLTMSASEMLTLIRYFPYIFCAVVPFTDTSWILFLKLRGVVEMTVSPALHESVMHQCSFIISEYLQLLQNLFPCSMKPKHHFLIHYPRVILQSGSLWNMNCMRFESKHREAKITSKTSISRVNVCSTIAKKHQLRLNYLLLSHKVLSSLIFDKNSIETICVHSLPNSSDFLKLIPISILVNNSLQLIRSVVFEEKLIKKGTILMAPTEDDPRFHVVETIVVNGDRVLLLAKVFLNVFLNRDVESYELLNETCDCTIIYLPETSGHILTHLVRTQNGSNYFVRKWF